MRTNMVITLTGADRIGIVEEVSKELLGAGTNVEASRMARLGGEFAMLMLVSLPSERLATLEAAVEALKAQGYKVTTSTTELIPVAHSDWQPFEVEVRGADHEGIMHDIAAGLSQRGITIESLETGRTRASVSGTPLFTMTAVVSVPPELAESDWMAELSEAGDQANVDITISEAEKR